LVASWFGKVGIYRGLMAVRKRVGSKENVDRWIGGLGTLREERVPDYFQSRKEAKWTVAG